MALTPEDRVMVLAPIVRGRKGEFKKEMETLLKHGYTRARVDGEIVNLDDDLNLDRKSTRLNSSHANISYAVFCLKKKNKRLLYRLVAEMAIFRKSCADCSFGTSFRNVL